MLKTSLCDVLGIEVPIILAPMGTCTSAELAAAVSPQHQARWSCSHIRRPEPAPVWRSLWQEQAVTVLQDQVWEMGP
jgi:NAD(P)H-dependent flavin oxidoreductase YrpB (nitropropane dioxygenase family)